MKLKVRARGDLLVAHHELQDHPTHPTRAWIGRTSEPGCPSSNEAVTVPTCAEADPMHSTYLGEYRTHVIQGALWAADEATAKYCGVKFDPTFGGAPVAKQPDADASSTES